MELKIYLLTADVTAMQVYVAAEPTPSLPSHQLETAEIETWEMEVSTNSWVLPSLHTKGPGSVYTCLSEQCSFRTLKLYY